MYCREYVLVCRKKNYVHTLSVRSKSHRISLKPLKSCCFQPKTGSLQSTSSLTRTLLSRNELDTYPHGGYQKEFKRIQNNQ